MTERLKENDTVFEKIIEPVLPIVEDQCKNLTPHHNEKLNFQAFFRLLIYFFCREDITSAKLFIISFLNKGILSPELKLQNTSYTSFLEAFGRFPPELFQAIFKNLILSIGLISIPELAAFGPLICVDGSLFPTINSMMDAEYKKDSNAVRLHLSFELNRMIAVDFLIGCGNSSERAAIRKMLVKGSTYIADRGYFSFELFHDILKAKAHFIIRVKSNLVFTPVESFPVQMPDTVKALFGQVTDELICCTNDLHEGLYRLVRFRAGGELFYIMTDRMELTTFQVIMLYSYRWQVELLFRYFKHTMKGLHIIHNTTHGITIQFHAIFITALLQLKLKQDILLQSENQEIENCENDPLLQSENRKLDNDEEEPHSQHPGSRFSKKSNPYQFFNMIGNKIKDFWKIGVHWMSTLREILSRPFNDWAVNVLSR